MIPTLPFFCQDTGDSTVKVGFSLTKISNTFICLTRSCGDTSGSHYPIVEWEKYYPSHGTIGRINFFKKETMLSALFVLQTQ